MDRVRAVKSPDDAQGRGGRHQKRGGEAEDPWSVGWSVGWLVGWSLLLRSIRKQMR